MNRLFSRFLHALFILNTGFLTLALPACKTQSTTSTLSFSEYLEGQENVPLSSWIEAIAQASLQSIATPEVVLVENNHLTEIITQVQTVIVRPQSPSQKNIYEELVYTKAFSGENDAKPTQSINALRIENQNQTNLNAMDDEDNILHITNLFERNPVYENSTTAANLLVCNALAHDYFQVIESYPNYFSFFIDTIQDQVMITWSCNDPEELNEAIKNTYFAKAGVGGFNGFEEQIICNKQGVLQKAQWTMPSSYGTITLQAPNDPNLISTYLEDLFDPTLEIGDPLNSYPEVVNP